MSTTKFFKSSLVFSRKNVLLLLFVLLLLCNYPAQAQSQATSGSDLRKITQIKQDDWINFPYTIQISPYIGMGTISKIPKLLDYDNTKSTKQRSNIIGASIDIGVFQIRRFIRKHFHCYPKLGLALNFGRLKNSSSLIGGLIYLEPQYDYLARWEIFPSLGIGIVYANRSGTNAKEPVSDKWDNKAVSPDNDAAKGFYRQGLHLDLSLALVANIKITPHWQLSPSIAYNYLRALEKEDEDQHSSQKDMDLRTVRASIALGYTPSPSLVRYPGLGNNKGNRVDVGWLSAFKKFEPPPKGLDPQNQPEQQGNTESKGGYYYVGGIYGQWSLHLCNSHAMTLATEWVLDGAAAQALKGKLKTSPLKISLLGGHEFRWGKLFFGQQIGFYLVNNQNPAPTTFIFYTRLALDYKLTEFLFIGTSLRTNFLLNIKKDDFAVEIDQAETDFIDFRISYSF